MTRSQPPRSSAKAAPKRRAGGDVAWNKLMADEVDRLLAGPLAAHPLIRRHGNAGYNRAIIEDLTKETKSWRKDASWTLDRFFTDIGRADLHLAGLMAFKAILARDDAPTSRPKPGRLVKPKIHVGDLAIDGDLDLDEVGPTLVTGSLRVSGAIVGKGLQGAELAPGNPLYVAGDVRCKAMHVLWHTVIGGKLDVGDLLICLRKSTFAVAGRIRARVVLGKDMEWELWNARQPIEAEVVELSRYDPKAGKAFDRSVAWWQALGDVVRPQILAKRVDLWPAYRKDPEKFFVGPPRMRTWANKTPPTDMVPHPLVYEPIEAPRLPG